MSDPSRFSVSRRRLAAAALAVGLFAISAGQAASASDHLDSPSVIADPRADIGDLYAWMASDGRADFAMPTQGRWLLNVIWTKPLPASSETDYETVFSSLSFELDDE